MGKKLSGSAEATPLVNITEKEGSFLQGVLRDRREVKTQYGMRPVYTLELEDTDMSTVIKNGNSYDKCDVAQGANVGVFAPTLLDRALLKAAPGDTLRIVYQGLGKSTKKGRNAPHMFDVEIV